MQHYLEALVERFEKKYKTEIKPQQLPFISESKVRKLEEEAEANNEKPKYDDEAASPIMASLYSASSCRPDVSVPTLRLARRVTRWNVADDAKLRQYLGYLKGTA